MRKSLFLLSVLLIGLTVSCSKDDDSPNNSDKSTAEKLIGTWALRDRSEIGIDYCELSTTIEFASKNQLNLNLYIGDEPEDCQSMALEGNWTVLENNKIKIKTFQKNEIDTIHVQFINHDQRIKIYDTDGSGHVETYAKQ